MKVLVVLGCVSQKSNRPGAACKLYTSSLFKKHLAYARTLAPDARIRILSAKYGLIRLDTFVSPYDLRLTPAVLPVLLPLLQTQVKAEGVVDKVLMLCGSTYRVALQQVFPSADCVSMCPDVSLGKRLAWLTTRINRRD